jgi:hypothetical protein
MKRKILIGFFLVVFALFCFWFFYLRTERDNRLIKQGNEIVKKIDDFKIKNGRLPNLLNEIDVKEKEGADAIYYQKETNSAYEYIIWFGTSLGESKIYYSDSKKWKDFNR